MAFQPKVTTSQRATLPGIPERSRTPWYGLPNMPLSPRARGSPPNKATKKRKNKENERRDTEAKKRRAGKEGMGFTDPTMKRRHYQAYVEDEDDEEIIYKSEPVDKTRDFSGPSSCRSTVATSKGGGAPCQKNTTPPSTPPSSSAAANIDVPPNIQPAEDESPSIARRRAEIMLELAQVEIEKKRAELRELEVRQKLMTLEHEA